MAQPPARERRRSVGRRSPALPLNLNYLSRQQWVSTVNIAAVRCAWRWRPPRLALRPSVSFFLAPVVLVCWV